MLNRQYNPHYFLGGPPSPPHLCYKYTKPIALYQNDTAYEEVMRRLFIVNLMPGLYPLTVYYEVIWAQTI